MSVNYRREEFREKKAAKCANSRENCKAKTARPFLNNLRKHDKTASVIIFLSSGIEMSYAERQCADVSKFLKTFRLQFYFFNAQFLAKINVLVELTFLLEAS